jgi:phosphoribosylamine-glycine ligase
VEGRFAALLAGVASGAHDADARRSIRFGSGAAVAVALVDEGYPDAVRGGGRIEGLERLMGRDDLWVFHGASEWRDGAWTVRGGRAAIVVARDASRRAARARVYEALKTLGGSGWRFRSDIAAGAPDGATLGAGLEARPGGRVE